MTCNGVAVFSRLTTAVSLPTKVCTSRFASATSSGEATVPVRITMPFIGVAVTCASGMASFSIPATLPRWVPTRSVAEYTTAPVLSVADSVVSPAPLPNTYSRVGVRG